MKEKEWFAVVIREAEKRIIWAVKASSIDEGYLRIQRLMRSNKEYCSSTPDDTVIEICLSVSRLSEATVIDTQTLAEFRQLEFDAKTQKQAEKKSAYAIAVIPDNENI